MSNSFKVIDLIARETMRVAHENLGFIGTVDRQYDKTFEANRGKIGNVLRVKTPNAFTRRQGSKVMEVQDVVEESQSITVATQDGCDLRVNSAELTFDTPEGIAGFSKTNIEPAVKSMLSGIEADFLAFATKATYNTQGTAGTAITTISPILTARARLNQMLAPKDGRFVQMDSLTMAGLVNGNQAYFNPAPDLSKQYREGMVKRTGAADFIENERTWTLTNSSDVTANTNADALVTDGGVVVAVSEDLAQADQVVGSVFTIAGVYACHPETKAALPYLQDFVVEATGAVSVTVSPAIRLTGARKNVCKSTGADLATTDFNEKAIVFRGAASTSYVQSLMYAPEAYQFVTAKLPNMGDAESCVSMVEEGLALRVWRASDIRNDEMLLRIDIMYGMAALRREWGCRLIGAANA